MRIYYVIKKEFKEYVRDNGFLITMLLEPLILMLVFGYAFQANIANLNTIAIDDDNSSYSHAVIQAIDDSEYFKRIPFNGTLEEAEDKLKASNVRAVFHIQSGFESKMKNATMAEVYLYLDSSDYAIYNFLKGASSEVIKGSLNDIIQFIVGDLEKERAEKQKKIDEIQKLVDDVDHKSRTTINKVNDLTKQFDKTRQLIKETEEKIDSSKLETKNINNEVISLKSNIEDSIDNLDNLSASLKQLKDINSNLTVYIDPILIKIDRMKSDVKGSIDDINKLKPLERVPISKEYYNMGEFTLRLDNNEITGKEINTTAHELQDTYYDVQDRIDDVYLELATLKKEFLSQPLDISKRYMFGEISYFEYLTPAIMTLVLFFIGVMLTTINIVDERTKKTLFRVSTTPLKKIELFGGKFLIFFLVGVVEVIYVLLLAVFIFNVNIVGSFIDATLVLLLLMAASIGLGLLISAIVKTMRQAVMLVPIVIIPSVLISQTFSPIEVMPKFMQYVAYLSPMFYSNVALREIMIKGTGLSGVIIPVIVLGCYAFFTLALGVLISKKRIE